MKRAALGLAVSLSFLFLLSRQVDFLRAAESLRTTDYVILLAALPAYFGAVWFRTLRWQQLLIPVARLPAPGLFVQVVIGYMANDVLPLRVGEVVRAYLLGRRHSLAKVAVLGTIAIERLTDGLILLAFAGAVAFALPLEGWMQWVIRTMAVAFVGGGLAMLALLFTWRRVAQALFPESAASEVEGRSGGSARAMLHRVVEGFLGGAESLRRPRPICLAGFHGTVAWLFEAGVFYAVALAMGVTIPFSVLLLSMALANLSTALPSSQAGIGPFEYFAAQTLVIFGTDSSVAATYALLVHAVLILPVTLLGFAFLWRENLSLGRLTREAIATPASSFLVPRSS